MADILTRMSALGVTQVQLILELQKRGIQVQAPAMSYIIRGIDTTPKGKRVKAECERIISDMESNAYTV